MPETGPYDLIFASHVVEHLFEPVATLGKLDVLPDMVLQTLNAVMADYKPQFQGAETTPQRNTPITVVVDQFILTGFQIFGVDIERLR